MHERDVAWKAYLAKSKNMIPREIFNAGWHAALAAVQKQYDDGVLAARTGEGE
jgi:hypothetical protein